MALISSRAMLAFAKSVLIGALIGAAPFLLVTIPMGARLAYGAPHGEIWLLRGVVFAALPLFASLALVLVSSLVVGLPTVWLLARFKRDALTVYALCGAAWGAVVAAAFFGLVAQPLQSWHVIMGALSGAATALTWAHSRRDDRRRAERKALSEAEYAEISDSVGRGAKRSFLERLIRPGLN